MRKLGLIGGTGPESTIAYYKALEYGTQEKLKAKVFPNMVIESLSVFEVLSYCDKGDFDALSEYLLSGFRNLANAGAEFLELT